mgnify:CR=1 FL=1
MSLDYRQIFIDQYKANITRRGADRLLEWLLSTDFFTAPASTRFHAAYEGGLVEHSLNVYRIMMKKHFVEGEDDPESAAICTLLHDICKAGFYEVSFRNRKNDAGVWEKVPYYTINDKFPYGHGEKSVFLIERFMRLKNEEAVAIRWHMGGFDDAAKSGSFAIAHAYENYPLAVKLHLSDLEATYLCENRNPEEEES